MPDLTLVSLVWRCNFSINRILDWIGARDVKGSVGAGATARGGTSTTDAYSPLGMIDLTGFMALSKVS